MRRSIALLCLLFLFAGCGDSAPSGSGDDAGNDATVMDAGADAETDSSVPEVPYFPPRPVCTDDPDTDTASFEITSIAIPRASDPGGIGGFNVDGLNSTDYTVAGCNWMDQAGGVENAFAGIATTLNGFAQALDADIDIYEEVEALIDRGDLSITLELSHWNGQLDDSAVTTHITASYDGGSQEIDGCGRMQDGVLEGFFGEELPLAISIDNNTIAIVLRDPQIRLVLSETQGAVTGIDLTQSYVGGYILWDDGTETDVPGELNVPLRELISHVDGVNPSVLQNILQTVGNNADIEGYPELSVCTETYPGLVSADSFSVAFRLGGTIITE